jgi:hypothetical protein
MSDLWVDADVPALLRLARLVDLVGRGDVSAALLSEIRQLEDRFGLSPLARRRLEWQLVIAADDAAESDASDQDERWLRAV